MTLIDASNPSCPGAVAWWKPSCIERSKGLQSIQGLWLVTVTAYIQWCPCLHRYFPCTVSWISIQIPTCTVSWFSIQIFSMHRWKTTEFRSRNTFLCIPLFSVANESKAPLPAAAWMWRHISKYIVLTETDRPAALLAVLASPAGSCYQGIEWLGASQLGAKLQRLREDAAIREPDWLEVAEAEILPATLAPW